MVCIPKPHYLLPHLNPEWFYHFATSLPSVVLENRLLNVCVCVCVCVRACARARACVCVCVCVSVSERLNG